MKFDLSKLNKLNFIIVTSIKNKMLLQVLNLLSRNTPGSSNETIHIGPQFCAALIDGKHGIKLLFMVIEKGLLFSFSDFLISISRRTPGSLASSKAR